MLYLIITIDVETPQTPFFNGLIKKNAMELKTPDGDVGTSWILNELNKRGLKGVFYVNAYEKAKWGEKEIASLCKNITKQGHEVGLHTHPAWMYDVKRPHMWQYSLNEQINIIKQGKSLIENWVDGYKVVSHRAGAYGLNTDTLKALKKNNIFIDSSMFYSHPNCKVTWNKNLLNLKDNVLEIPVTGFIRKKQLTISNIPVYKKDNFVKTDIDWTTRDEIVNYISSTKDKEINILNLFMHSYSFVKYNDDYSRFEIDHNDMQRLRDILDILCDDDTVKNVKSDDLYGIYKEHQEYFSSSNDLPPLVIRNKSMLSVISSRLGL